MSNNVRDRKEVTFSNKNGELLLTPRLRYIFAFTLYDGFEARRSVLLSYGRIKGNQGLRLLSLPSSR